MLGDDCALVGQFQPLAAFSFSQCGEFFKFFRVGNRRQGDIYCLAAVGYFRRIHTDFKNIVDVNVFFEVFDQLFPVGRRNVGGQSRRAVIVKQIPELSRYQSADGILNAPAGDKQSRTAGDADYRHKESLFIAEKVSRRDF